MTRSVPPVAFAVLLAVPAAAADLLSPRAGQTELEAVTRVGFTAAGSVVAVREFDIPGSDTRYSDLGLTTAETVGLRARRWLDSRNAVSAEGRWLFLRGRAGVSGPFDFNGATVAGGQELSTRADAWTLSLRWERRLAPGGLAGWDVRARAGIDYTHLDFVIDGGHAPVAPGSRGTETKEDFYLQELPVPVLGLEALRRFGAHAIVDARADGSWIHSWDSLRREGGEVRLSQSQLDLSARVLWDDPRLGGWRPALGVFFSHFAQDEVSGEDGNFARYVSYGPEVAVLYAF